MTRSASAKPASRSPRAMWYSVKTWSDASMSVTAGSGSVRSRMWSRAACARARVGAATRATGSPTWRISSAARTGWSSFMRWMTFSPGTSAAVSTTTRLQSKAGSRSIPSRRACGSVARTVLPCHAPGTSEVVGVPGGAEQLGNGIHPGHGPRVGGGIGDPPGRRRLRSGSPPEARMGQASRGGSGPALASSWLVLVLHDVGTGPAADRAEVTLRVADTGFAAACPWEVDGVLRGGGRTCRWGRSRERRCTPGPGAVKGHSAPRGGRSGPTRARSKRCLPGAKRQLLKCMLYYPRLE